MKYELNKDAANIVEAFRCTYQGATDKDTNREDQITIIHEDGDWLMNVPADIPAEYLYLMFKYGAHQFHRGEHAGIEQIQRKARALFGAKSSFLD